MERLDSHAYSSPKLRHQSSALVHFSGIGKPRLTLRQITDAVTTRRVLNRTLWWMHAILAAVMFWWCFILAQPGETFSTSLSYTWFATHWPRTEPGWAMMFLFAGMIGAVGLVFKQNDRIGHVVRKISAGILGMAHMSVAVATFDSNPFSTGPGVYTALAALALLRIAGEN